MIKAGSTVYIEALAAVGDVVEVLDAGKGFKVSYARGKKIHVEDFEAADVKVRKKCRNPSDHKWNKANDPQYCLNCGISFVRYTFMECP